MNSLIKYLQNKNISIEFEPEILPMNNYLIKKLLKYFRKLMLLDIIHQ